MTVEEEIYVCDPVKVAVRLFHGSEDNRLLWGWYCRTLGREQFRDILYQKYCENKVDGALRNPAAAFQVTLKRALIRANGGVQKAITLAAKAKAAQQAPVASAAPQRTSAAPAAPQTKSAAMMVDPFDAVVKSFTRCSAPRSEEQRQRDWERNKELQLRQLAEWQSQQPS